MPADHFNGLLVEQAGIEPGHRVLDLGCGTAILTMTVKRRCPDAVLTGLDGDPEVLEMARQKILAAGLDIELLRGLASTAPLQDHSFERVVSSLVFHHMRVEEKVRSFSRVRELLVPGGELHVADWGRAQNLFMRVSLLPVQLLDGFAQTVDNVRGRLPELMAEAGLLEAEETYRGMTMFGTLSLYRAVAP